MGFKIKPVKQPPLFTPPTGKVANLRILRHIPVKQSIAAAVFQRGTVHARCFIHHRKAASLVKYEWIFVNIIYRRYHLHNSFKRRIIAAKRSGRGALKNRSVSLPGKTIARLPACSIRLACGKRESAEPYRGSPAIGWPR